MFGTYKEDDKSLKEIAKIQNEIVQKEKVLSESPIILEIEELKKKEKAEQRKIALRKSTRLSNYRSMFTDEEMNGKE